MAMKVGETCTASILKSAYLEMKNSSVQKVSIDLLKYTKDKLTQLFGNRFLKKSRTLKNSKNSALFEFLFCVGNPKGIGPARRIAEHILKDL